MSNQTERLEALLVRVQENRQQPRAVTGFASTMAGHAAPAPAPAVSAKQAQPAAPPERRAEPRPEPRAPEPRAKPAATPLEMAFENSVNTASVGSAAARAPIAGTAHGGPTQPLHSAPAAAPREGVMLVDPAPLQPGRPIAQVVSKHPPSTAATFGELLRRSLSLRPR